MRTSPDTWILSNDLLLDVLTLVLFGLYFGLLYRHRSSIALLFKSLTIRGQFDQLIDEQSVSFRGFVSSARLVGFVTLLTLGFKACLIWGEAAGDVELPAAFVPWLLPLLIGVLLAIGCYKWLLTRTISVLMGRRGPVESLCIFDRLYFALVALTLPPWVLLSALADPTADRVLFILEVIFLIILLLYYIFKNFSFFISRNLPILQWFLYLCAVEIFPVSFFVLFIRRGFEW